MEYRGYWIEKNVNNAGTAVARIVKVNKDAHPIVGAFPDTVTAMRAVDEAQS